MDLLQLWALVRRNWLMLVVSVLVGLGLSAGYSMLQPTVYAATSTGYVVAGNSSTVGEAFASSDLAAEKAATYLPLVQSRSVADAVAAELGISRGQVAGSLSATNEGVIFRISARAGTPELASAKADAAIRATSAAANDLETMTLTGDRSGDTVVRIVPMEAAVTPTRPVSPNWQRNLAIGAALGLLVGFGLVVLRHTLDRRVREATDVEELTGSSALAVVPLAKELANGVTLGRGPESEALRQLRTNLRFVNVDDPPRSIVITSPNASEGKSTIASHLAVALAESGQPTVLVDADLRRPSQSERFGVDGSVGLTQVLAGTVELTTASLATTQPHLLLLPAGRIPPNPSELVGSDRMRDLIEHLSQNFNVIIDAPPLLPVSDAGLLTAASDGALLIVRNGKTRTEQVTHAARKLELVNGTLLGVVLNMVARKDLGVAYGYGYGYGPKQYDYTPRQPVTTEPPVASVRPAAPKQSAGAKQPTALKQPTATERDGQKPSARRAQRAVEAVPAAPATAPVAHRQFGPPDADHPTTGRLY